MKDEKNNSMGNTEEQHVISAFSIALKLYKYITQIKQQKFDPIKATTAMFGGMAKVETALKPLAIVGYVLEALIHQYQDEHILKVLLNKQEQSYIAEHTDEVFDELVLLLSHIPNTTINRVPQEISNFMLDLLNAQDGEQVYNPFSGDSSFANLAPKQHFVGEEPDQTLWAFGQINNAIHQIEASIKNADPMNDQFNAKYSKIICFPPFGGKQNMAIENILFTLYNRLEVGGRLCIGVNVEFLFAGGNANKIKQKLIIDRAIEDVYLMPADLLSNTNIPFAILRLTKRNEDDLQQPVSDIINFIDLTCAVIDNKPYGTMRRFSQDLAQDATLQSFVKVVSEINDNRPVLTSCYCHKVELNGVVILDPAYHIMKSQLKRRSHKLTPLRNLLSVNHSKRQTFHDIKVIKSGYIKSYFTDIKSILNNVERQTVINNAILLQKDTLMVSQTGNFPYSAINNSTFDEEIAIASDVMCFKLLNPKTSLEYIQAELSKEYVTRQFKVYQHGTVRQHISEQNFLNIEIEVPSHIKQMEIRQSVISREMELLSKNRDELQDAIEKKRHDDYVTLIRTRKHAICQVLNDINPSVRLLIKKLETENCLQSDAIISQRSGRTVNDLMLDIQKQLNRINDIVQKLADEQKFGKPEKVHINKIIQQYIEGHQCEQFYYDFIPLKDSGEQIDAESTSNSGQDDDSYGTINISPNDLYQVLDNIVSNAKKYGFNANRNDYCIRIQIVHSFEDQSKIIMYISNNGLPLPKGMTPEKVFVLGECSACGTGIGGWQIKKIVEHYHGEVNLISNPKSEDGFTIIYSITLPTISK